MAGESSGNMGEVDLRLRALEEMVLGGGKQSDWLSVETLLDLVIVLFDECSNSTLRKEKSFSGFIDRGKCYSDVILFIMYFL